MFLPVFDGKNALKAADRLFNSISKGSTDFIPDLMAKNKAFEGAALDVTLNFQQQEMTDNAAKLLNASGAETVKQETKLAVNGDLGRVLGRLPHQLFPRVGLSHIAALVTHVCAP